MSRILIVEDDPRTSELLQELLDQSGFVAEVVVYGEDAVERVQEASYNLVLLDVNLPGIDGFDACRGIRVHTSVPIIMLTARGRPDDRVDGLENGADDYVSKPSTPASWSPASVPCCDAPRRRRSCRSAACVWSRRRDGCGSTTAAST